MLCRWQAAKGLAGLSNIYLAAMDALNQLNPQALFFLQGAGQTSLTKSPGDGYVTDTATLQKYNLSDPSAFFKTLLVRPYVNQVRPMLLYVYFSQHGMYSCTVSLTSIGFNAFAA